MRWWVILFAFPGTGGLLYEHQDGFDGHHDDMGCFHDRMGDAERCKVSVVHSEGVYPASKSQLGGSHHSREIPWWECVYSEGIYSASKSQLGESHHSGEICGRIVSTQKVFALHPSLSLEGDTILDEQWEGNGGDGTGP